MAENTRKVLINRHSTKAEAPIAKDMYLGEIAISHPENLSATTIYTKNGNVMVPFASCAMTMTMINNAISAADVTYDVKVKEGETFIEVASKGTDKAKVFEVSSKDVQSKEAFDAYSAATKTRIDDIASAVSDLTNEVVTGITGDSIITATIVDPGAGSNAYNLTHRAGHESTGFNKLTTDAYGHVTASTAVTTEDIQALGFKTSAQTGADLEALSASVVTNKTNIEALSGGTLQLSADTHNKIVSVYNSAATYADSAVATAIEGLDSESATTSNRHYITAITFENGKIKSIGEGTDPKLSVKKNGEGNVVASISVNDHEVTYETVNVATSGEIAELSGAVKSFSAETVSEFNSAFTAINDLSADTVDYVKSVSGNIVSVINAMDKNAEVVAGQVVTTVSQENGKVTETKASVKDLQLGGYSKDPNATGDIEGTDTINAALSKLENVIGANKITNSDKSIVVTEPTSIGATTGVKVNIKSGEKVIKLGNEGLYTDIKIAKINSSSDLVKDEYVLYGTDGKSQLGESIKIYKDQSLVSITLEDNDGSGKTGQYLKYTYIDASGKTQSTYVNVSSLLSEAEFADGLKVDDSGVVHGVVDPAGETFLTVGADGFKLSGVQAAIDAAKASATTKVVEGTDEGNNMTIVPTTGDSGSITYTVNLTDVASKVALDAEIAARKDVDGQTGQTYVANAGANYISDATSLNDADVKLDAALKAEENARTSQDNTIEASIGLAEDGSHVTTNGTYTSAATTVVGEIAALDKALKEVSDVVDSLDYTGLTNGNTKVVTDVKQENGLVSANATAVGDLVITAITASDTKVAANDSLATIAGKLQGQIDAMDSTGETTGNGYFLTSVQIADGKITAATQSDKVNSASTAESADKVAHALTMGDGTVTKVFDGSEAQTITFGKTVTGVGKSMSMDANGVVDVEIIDCGTY